MERIFLEYSLPCRIEFKLTWIEYFTTWTWIKCKLDENNG
jgi:hypothetical protein